MQDLHAHCNLRILKCKLCSEERQFDGHSIDEIESWKDRHYKDGKAVCVGAYKPHVRNALGPILQAGQPCTGSNGLPAITFHGPGQFPPNDIRRVEVLRPPLSTTPIDDSQPRLVYDDVGFTRETNLDRPTVRVRFPSPSNDDLHAALYNLPEDLTPVHHPLVKSISFRKWKDERNRCYMLNIEMDYHDGRIQGFHWATNEVDIWYGNRERYWAEYVRELEGSMGLKWKELPFTYDNWVFLITLDYELFGRSR